MADEALPEPDRAAPGNPGPPGPADIDLGSAHGYGIAHVIRAGSRDALQVDTGSLYPALHRLEREGAVASEWKTSENKQRVKVYRLTPQGRRKLTQERSRWDRLMEAMSASSTRRGRRSRRGHDPPLRPSGVALSRRRLPRAGSPAPATARHLRGRAVQARNRRRVRLLGQDGRVRRRAGDPRGRLQRRVQGSGARRLLRQGAARSTRDSPTRTPRSCTSSSIRAASTPASRTTSNRATAAASATTPRSSRPSRSPAAVSPARSRTRATTGSST